MNKRMRKGDIEFWFLVIILAVMFGAFSGNDDDDGFTEDDEVVVDIVVPKTADEAATVAQTNNIEDPRIQFENMYDACNETLTDLSVSFNSLESENKSLKSENTRLKDEIRNTSSISGGMTDYDSVMEY